MIYVLAISHGRTTIYKDMVRSLDFRLKQAKLNLIGRIEFIVNTLTLNMPDLKNKLKNVLNYDGFILGH